VVEAWKRNVLGMQWRAHYVRCTKHQLACFQSWALSQYPEGVIAKDGIDRKVVQGSPRYGAVDDKRSAETFELPKVLGREKHCGFQRRFRIILEGNALQQRSILRGQIRT
jgi:hypothetical protein